MHTRPLLAVRPQCPQSTGSAAGAGADALTTAGGTAASTLSGGGDGEFTAAATALG